MQIITKLRFLFVKQQYSLFRHSNRAVSCKIVEWICSALTIFTLSIVLVGVAVAQTKIDFQIDKQRADLALTQFAQQSNTTLIFPFDLAEKETANALNGPYSIELGIVKLLEGTGLYPASDESGMISIRPVSEQTEKLQIASEFSAERVPQAVRITDDSVIERIAIVGTRASPRSVIESSVPLDIIGSQEFAEQGATDITSMLSALVPSFNVNDQPINDASSLVRPANLRGMASDHTLVLLNGKRRHRSAVITFLGGGLSDGAQGPDISTIPASSLKQIEVLRDGAAAQYGSDAIAGVINFVLKDDNNGGMLESRYGSYFEGDGEMFQLQGNIGLPLTDSGFLNLSTEYRQQNPTNRSVQREDAARLMASGNSFISDPAQIWGTPELKHDLKFSANAGYSVDEDMESYLFMSLAQREVEGGFYFRNPHTRSGVNDGGVDADGTPLLLVGDLDGVGQGISCPNVRITDDNILDNPDFAIIADNSTQLGANCFAFNELFPGGFTPKFGGELEDYSIFMGVKGETAKNWLYDFSVSIGFSKIDYAISDTINPSLGPSSPTEFSPGSASQLEKNVNLDVSKQFQLGLTEPANFAAGLEWRRENFKQTAGDPASFAVGPLGFDDSTETSQGFGIGSNGFPGYKPEAAGDWGRGNWALYGDLELTPMQGLFIGMAARYENFTDFGSTFDGKLSARLQLNEAFALRGSVSTGFKAPTVGQSNVINVTTAFASNGLEDQATLPPTNPISLQLGATPLQPEESTNTSFGLVGNPSKELFVTLDYFRIQLEDRISTTSALPLSQTDINTLLTQGVLDASSFSSAKYFTNDFDTTTQGVDLVLNYETVLWKAATKFLLAYNWTDTTVDRVTVYTRVDENGLPFEEQNLTEQRIRMIEQNLPEHRFSATIKQQYSDWQILYRLNYFGEFYEDHLDASAGLDIESGAEVTFDFEVGYNLNAHTQLAAGVKNLFDNNPDQNPFKDLVGSLYPPTSPIGINGGFYYARAIYFF